MADTANFAWTKPVVDGSSGAWGGILNTALDDIDTDLNTVKTTADDAAAENLTFPIIVPAMTGQILGDGDDDASLDRSVSAGTGLTNVTGAVLSGTLVIPIEGLAPGMRITGFKSRGQSVASGSLALTLRYLDTTGTAVSAATIHSHSTTLETLTKSGLTVDVVADRRYFVEAIYIRPSISVTPRLFWVQPVVTRP